MKLAIKLVSSLVFCITILIMVEGYLSVQRERDLFMTDMAHDANLFGQAIKGLIADVWRTGGESRVTELISDLNQRHFPMHMRWVWLNAETKSPFAPMAPQNQLVPVLEGRDISIVGHDQQMGEILLTYIPVKVSPAQSGALEISESLSSMSDYIHTTIVRTLGITGAMILISIFVVAVLGYRVVGRRLQHLAQVARGIGSGDLVNRTHLTGHDELTELGRAMNIMSDQLLESQERVQRETAARIGALVQLRHEDRLKTVGRLASGMAHELGTPLNVVSGHAGLIATGAVSEEEIINSAGIIKGQAERMTALIKQLLNFSRRSTVDQEIIDIYQLVKQTADLIMPLSQKQNVRTHLVPSDETLLARVNSGQIQQVLINIINNALHAVKAGGAIEMKIVRYNKSDAEERADVNSYIKIEIRDDGDGIPEEDLPHIFEPFFTTKDVGEGTGLGLSIAYGIVREYDGWIEVTSGIGQGSCFSIYLPEEIRE